MRSMTFFNFLLEAALGGSALILLACLVRATLRRTVGSGLCYVAWLLVALRLLLPISLPNPAVDALRPGLSTDPAARPIADQLRTRFIDAIESLPELVPAHHEDDGDPVRRFALETRRGRTGATALAIYLCGAAVVGAWMHVRDARVRRRFKRDRVRALDGDALEAYRALCERQKVRPLPVYFVEPLASCCLVGVFKPYVAVPLGADGERLEMMLRHAIGHQRAHDGLWSFLRDLCVALHWVNPLVWVAAGLSRQDAEAACDERVAKSLTGDERARYAKLLADRGACAAPHFCAHVTGAPDTRGHVAARAKLALRPARPRHWLTAALAALGAFALLLSFATRESYALPTVGEPPCVAWAASLSSVPDEQTAVACARRFLESPFVLVSTDGLDFCVTRLSDGWLLRATEQGRALPVSVRLGEQGDVLMFENFRDIGDIPVGERRYAHQSPLKSVSEYLDAFFRAEIPGMDYEGARVLDDVWTDGMRYIILETKGAQTPGEYLTLAVEPEARVLSYDRMGASPVSGAKTALDARLMAALDMTEMYGFSHRSVDACRFEERWDEQARAWDVRCTLDRADATGAALDYLNGVSPDAARYAAGWRVSEAGDITSRERWTAQ